MGKRQRLSKQLLSDKNKPKLIAFVIVFALFGLWLLTRTFAAGSFASVEPENSTLTGNASQANDSAASGGRYVQFSSQATPNVGGLFVTRAELDRAKLRRTGTTQPFRSSADAQTSRANAALDDVPSPFYMDPTSYRQNIKYAWSWSSCPDSNANDNNSLADAVKKLENEGYVTSLLARQYALTGDTRYADKAKEFMLAWANRSTPVNMYDFIVDPNTFNGGLTGDDGTTCTRPWNFALDGLFQGYGLINFSDAYLLMNKNGYSLTATENTKIREYLVDLTEAVNSSFHAWTRWADNHQTSSSYTRYRADNHLSWGLAPLLSAAAALNDQALADYCLNGGTWTDSRAGAYKNPSHIKDVINRAILSSGRIIDEAPTSEGGFGRPGYAFYHLWAMHVVAKVAETHYGQDIWNYKGSDSRGLEDAYRVETDRLSSQTGSAWQYEMAYNKWPTASNLNARNSTNRLSFIQQSIGPVVLLLGQ